MSSIFVQIPSYKDSELLPTLKDCIRKSSKKNKITFGLVWQKEPHESIGKFSKNPDCRVIDVPWNQSKGLGWARSLTQGLYQDEDYTLQLDSHHRFSPNWDMSLIEMLKSTQSVSPKPLLTAYAAGYDPANDKILTPLPCQILPRDFKSSGTIWFNPTNIFNIENIHFPIRARLVSGHYYFTLGQHCKEYKYDPDMYFAGDEICLTVRSYTLGYDLFHPDKCFVWHHYGREDRSKHWNDHGDKQKQEGIVDKTWGERDEYSKKRIRQLLGEEHNSIDLGVYGLGTERTIKEYETYSGIDFKNKRIHNCAINGIEPPVSFASHEDYEAEFVKKIPIRIAQWPRSEYLKMGKSLEALVIEFINLRRVVIHRDVFNYIDVMNMMDNIYQATVVADNIPMRVVFTAIVNGQTSHVWERDLKEGIHWS